MGLLANVKDCRQERRTNRKERRQGRHSNREDRRDSRRGRNWLHLHSFFLYLSFLPFRG